MLILLSLLFGCNSECQDSVTYLGGFSGASKVWCHPDGYMTTEFSPDGDVLVRCTCPNNVVDLSILEQ